MKRIALPLLCLALCAGIALPAFALEEGGGPDGVIEKYNVVYDGEYIRTDAGITNEELDSGCVGRLVGDESRFYYMKDDCGNPLLETTLLKTGMLVENEAEFMAMAVVRGDVTGDGLTDNMDAARLLMYDAGLIRPYAVQAQLPPDAESSFDPVAARVSLYVEAAGDVTGDGLTDNMDAARLLLLDAGVISRP